MMTMVAFFYRGGSKENFEHTKTGPLPRPTSASHAPDALGRRPSKNTNEPMGAEGEGTMMGNSASGPQSGSASATI